MENLTTNSTADQRYLFLKNEINAQIKMLQSRLKKHSLKQRNDSGNFGYVGDLVYIKEKLMQANNL